MNAPRYPGEVLVFTDDGRVVFGRITRRSTAGVHVATATAMLIVPATSVLVIDELGMGSAGDLWARRVHAELAAADVFVDEGVVA